jgi:hypothetical protein
MSTGSSTGTIPLPAPPTSSTSSTGTTGSTSYGSTGTSTGSASGGSVPPTSATGSSSYPGMGGGYGVVPPSAHKSPDGRVKTERARADFSAPARVVFLPGGRYERTSSE